jgi:hypothetical protein
MSYQTLGRALPWVLTGLFVLLFLPASWVKRPWRWATGPEPGDSAQMLGQAAPALTDVAVKEAAWSYASM